MRYLKNYLRLIGILVLPAAVSVGFMALNFLPGMIVGFIGNFVAGLVASRVVMDEYNLSGLKEITVHGFLAILFCSFSIFLSYLGCEALSL